MTDTATTAPPPIPPAPASVPGASVNCLRCEYDLRGQPRDGNCPECGTPVEPSWQRHEAAQAAQPPPLHLSSTSWLRAMAIGCCLLTASALLTCFDALRVVTGMGGDDGFNVIGVAVGLG